MRQSEKVSQRSENSENNKREINEKAYSYDEAIELAGTGWYNRGLLATLALSLLAMATDMFGFSVVVTLASCDLQLDQVQKSILVSMPFLGPVVTAYAWGYFSDTRGRQLSLQVGMAGGFVASTLSAFSPNWIVLAVLKLMATCFTSCAQSVTYTLLGESCAGSVKSGYMLFMTSSIHLGSAVYFTAAYLIGYLDFSYDLGVITFVPWRLLVLVLALPLGLVAVSLAYFHESPKFLLNAGREDEALDVLGKIYKRNGRQIDEYPVHRLVLNEDGNISQKNYREISLLQSMRQQTVPLFKPPLLQSTLLLYYLIFVVYASSSSMYMWLPFLADALSAPSSTQANGLCGLIEQSNSINNNPDVCSVDQKLVIAAVISSVGNCFLNILMSLLSSWKKALVVTITGLSAVSCILTTAIPDPNVAIVFYFGVVSGGLTMGPLSTYFVELFPTSFRGMAACLGVMVARSSSIAGINVVGPLITTHCKSTFYGFSALVFSGALMALLLPSERSVKRT